MRQWVMMSMAGAMMLAGCQTRPPTTMPAPASGSHDPRTITDGSQQGDSARDPRHVTADARPGAGVADRTEPHPPSPFVDPPLSPATQPVRAQSAQSPHPSPLPQAGEGTGTSPSMTIPRAGEGNGDAQRTPSPGTPGEGGGEGLTRSAQSPHPNPLPQAGEGTGARHSLALANPTTQPVHHEAHTGLLALPNLPTTAPADRGGSRLALLDPGDSTPPPAQPPRRGLGLLDRFVAPTTAPSVRPQSRIEARTTLADSNSSYAALWTRSRREPLILLKADALKIIETSADYDIFVLPLPGADPARWQPIIRETAARPELAMWLGRVDVSGWEQKEQSKRETAREADREARQRLRSGLYRAILGDDAPAGKEK